MADRSNSLAQRMRDAGFWLCSASAFKRYDHHAGGCQRRWAFRQIARLKEPQTQAQKDGVRAHEIAEQALHGVPPDVHTKHGKWVFEELPYLPRVSAVSTEVEFVQQIGDVWTCGYVDWVAPELAQKGDHKFTSGLEYALSPEALIVDPAALLYTATEPVFKPTWLRWIYVSKKRREAQPVDAVVSQTWAREWLGDCFVPVAREMQSWITAFAGVPPAELIGAINALLPINPGACLSYGQACPHLKHCTLR